MGELAESCGGYEVEYDPYYDGLSTGTWTTREGESISVTKMTLRHLEGAARVAERAAARATCTSDEEMWGDWASLLETEIDARRKDQPVKAPPKASAQPQRGKTVQMKCHCGQEYAARTADIARGWGLSCCKRCAAIRRDYGRPAAKPVRAATKLNQE